LAGLQLYTVYNSTTGNLYITKGRRAAERIAATANKLCSLINIKEQNICESSHEFFKKHHIEKNKVHFCWDTTPAEKMDLFKKFFKFKDFYA
jgi:hypothetical protein